MDRAKSVASREKRGCPQGAVWLLYAVEWQQWRQKRAAFTLPQHIHTRTRSCILLLLEKSMPMLGIWVLQLSSMPHEWPQQLVSNWKQIKEEEQQEDGEDHIQHHNQQGWIVPKWAFKWLHVLLGLNGIVIIFKQFYKTNRLQRNSLLHIHPLVFPLLLPCIVLLLFLIVSNVLKRFVLCHC